MNQDENETTWEDVYEKDEALWYACCQMRRAARMLDLEETQHENREYLVNIYGNGLDLCADECEKAIDPDELTRMKRETHPSFCPTCGRSGEAREANDTGGVDVCYDTWHGASI